MSSSIAAALRPIPVPATTVLRSDPAAQAFMLRDFGLLVGALALARLASAYSCAGRHAWEG
jgi:hypothetical protein